MSVEGFKPYGWSTVAPRFITDDVVGLANFIRSVFDGKGADRTGAPTELKIGDTTLLVSDGGGVRTPMPMFLHVYTRNADLSCQRALDAGAELIEEPADMPYGDRRATVRDPWGNLWQVATHGALSCD